MASSDSSNATIAISNNPTTITTQLISINAANQLPLKLTSSNFTSWRAQFVSLLIGYDLLGYVDGTNPCPPKEGFSSSASTSPSPAYLLWFRQDKLLLHAILASVSEAVIPLIATSETSRDAWSKLSRYANRSRTRVMQLKEDLSHIQRGSRSVIDFLHAVKIIADELAVIDSPLSADDITLHVLNGLGSEYRDIAVPIRAGENPLTFEELHDLLLGHESYLRRRLNGWRKRMLGDKIKLLGFKDMIARTGDHRMHTMRRVRWRRRFLLLSSKIDVADGTLILRGRNRNSE